ncbi:exosortase-associated protein EpsI, B-type [Ideonella sp. DXS22W]|uniref:Exosortase-associated protein EpsI, B-type n=1 Tax=Pseudaquabacterium inlustre TaxID=2984192 RepID=A0ABU9CG03_9BURK
MTPTLRKALVIAVAMAIASVMAWAMKPVPQRGRVPDLEAIVPPSFGQWEVDRSIVPVPPSPDLQKVIDSTYDKTLARTYRNADGYRVMLSLAFGGSQTDGMNYHRPEVCYPAQGFDIRQKPESGDLAVGSRVIRVKRMVAGSGARNEPITYWLVVGGEVTGYGLQRKLLTIKHGLTGRIPEGMLIRVSSIDTAADKAFAIQQQFVEQMVAGLPANELRRFLGESEPAGVPTRH